MAVSVYIPSAVQKSSFFSTPSPEFTVCSLCDGEGNGTPLQYSCLENPMDDGHSDQCEVIPHCGLNVHFSNNEWWWASFHVFVSHLYVFFGEMSVWIIFPLFDWVVCFSSIELYELLVYFWRLTFCQLFHLLLFSPILRVVWASWWERLVMGKIVSCSGGQGLTPWSFNPFICWWMGLHSLHESCLAWDNLALESVGSMAGLMVTSKRVYAEGNLAVPPSLWWALQTHASTGDPPTLAGSFDSVSFGVTAPLLWVLVCAKFCLCLPRLEFLFPSVLWRPIIKSHWPSRLDSLGIPSPSVGSLGWEAGHGVQNLHNNGRTSLLLLFSSLWVTHLVGMGFDFIVIAPLLLSHCRFFFVILRGTSFLVGSSSLLLMVVQQLGTVFVLS